MKGSFNCRSLFFLTCSLWFIFASVAPWTVGLAQKPIRYQTRDAKKLDDQPRGEQNVRAFFPVEGFLDCELASVYIDDAFAKSKLATGTDLIVIVRLGDGETSGLLSADRSREVRRYFELLGRKTPIIAEGSRIHGNGRLDIYVAGRLFSVLPIRRGARLDLRSCIG